MKRELGYVIFETEAGWLGVLGSNTGLRRTTLPQPSQEEAHRSLGASLIDAVWSDYLFPELIARFRAYFTGRYVIFPTALDLSGATAFQRRVWEATCRIPYGETRSYHWVAERLKQPGAARAVGQALGRNPLPIIIPCHRVVASDGKPGGFTGGIATKNFLLQLENSAGARG